MKAVNVAAMACGACHKVFKTAYEAERCCRCNRSSCTKPRAHMSQLCEEHYVLLGVERAATELSKARRQWDALVRELAAAGQRPVRHKHKRYKLEPLKKRKKST